MRGSGGLGGRIIASRAAPVAIPRRAAQVFAGSAWTDLGDPGFDIDEGDYSPGSAYFQSTFCWVFATDDTMWRYELISDTWTLVQGVGPTGSPDPAYYGGILASGLTNLRLITVTAPRTRNYDWGTDTWAGSDLALFPDTPPSYGVAYTQSQDEDKVYAAGGSGGDFVDGSGNSVALHRYDVSGDTWAQMDSLDVGVPAAGIAATYDDTKLVLIGGLSDGGSGTSVTRIYDVGGDSWASGTPPPLTLSFPVVAGLSDGTVLYGGGRSAPFGTPQDRFWIYDVGLDSFTEIETAPAVGLGAVQGIVRGDVVFMGAGDPNRWVKLDSTLV